MAYNEFAYFYDELNGEADYDKLFSQVYSLLRSHGVEDGIVVDLGCGTGELTLMLAQAGYDMIGVDRSPEMLAVFRDKAQQLELEDKILLLNQDLLELDLYGTIRAAISTFDTYNHIGPYSEFDKAIWKAAFFMEKGGVFIFDLNTPYKNREVLGENQFSIECEDALCSWQNHYDPEEDKVELKLQIRDQESGQDFYETIQEYSYTLEQVKASLEKYGFSLDTVLDGETFGSLTDTSQRMLLVAVKQYTQEQQEEV